MRVTQPQQPSSYPMYPQQPPPGPPPRRRNAWIIVAVVVGCLVLLGAVALALGLTGSAENTGDDADDSSDEAADRGAPTSVAQPDSVPPACELLSKEQLAAVLQGQVPEPFGVPPEPAGEGELETRCEWRNDPYAGDSHVPPASITVRVRSTSTEEAAKAFFDATKSCEAPHGAKAPVTGADEACLLHRTFDPTGAPVEMSTAIARQHTIVVEVTYSHWVDPIDKIDEVAVTGTAAVLGKLLGGG